MVAERTFKKDQFIGPWRNADFKCGEPQLCVNVDVAPVTVDDTADDNDSSGKSGKGTMSEVQPDAPVEAPSLEMSSRRLQFMKDYCSYHLFPYAACESFGLGYTWAFHQANRTTAMHL